MNFSDALKELKQGMRLYRNAWSRNKWIAIIGNDEYSVDIWNNANSQPINLKMPWIGMHYGVGEFVPWTATNDDLLGNDWQVFKELGD